MAQETLSLFQKKQKQSPRYLFKLVPTARQAYMTRNKKIIPLFNVKHDYFKNSFFPSAMIEWNNLNSNIRNYECLAIFKKRISAFIRAFTNNTFHCHCPDLLKLITRLRLGLRHLEFHKFKNNLEDKLILSAVVVLLKQLLTTFFIVPTFQIKD